MQETTLNLGSGRNAPEQYYNVDALNHPSVDEVVNLNEYPWPWADESWAEIRMSHVLEHLDSVEDALRECSRILKPEGVVTVYWPVGMNERADPDHKHTWIWDTPEMYCGSRPWDVDVGLEVVDRDVELVSHIRGPLGACYKGVLKVVQFTEGQGRWMFDMPASSGEFTVRFRKTE